MITTVQISRGAAPPILVVWLNTTQNASSYFAVEKPDKHNLSYVIKVNIHSSE